MTQVVVCNTCIVVKRGSAKVDRLMTTSYRLSLVTISPFAAVWMQVLTQIFLCINHSRALNYPVTLWYSSVDGSVW